MAYKCPICGSNEVENPGDVCELCAIAQDPYAAKAASPVRRPAARKINVGNKQEEEDTSTARPTRKILLGGAPRDNVDPYGNEIPDPAVQVYAPGQVPDSNTDDEDDTSSDKKGKAKKKKPKKQKKAKGSAAAASTRN